MYKRTLFFTCCCLLYLQSAIGQAPEKPGAAEIFQELQRLGTLGSVLYVAAHPDDETTRLIPWLRSQEHTSALQSIMRTSSAVFYLQIKTHPAPHYLLQK